MDEAQVFKEDKTREGDLWSWLSLDQAQLKLKGRENKQKELSYRAEDPTTSAFTEIWCFPSGLALFLTSGPLVVHSQVPVECHHLHPSCRAW